MRVTIPSMSDGSDDDTLVLECASRGEGHVVLYIGGSGRSLTDRPNVFDGPLTKSFRVIAFDQRGLGRSGTPAGRWTTADYAADADRLLDLLGIDRCHVVGVSFGGMVAQELALRRPDLVDRLVLVATSSGGAGGRSAPIEELDRYEPRERFSMELALEDDRHSAEWQALHPELVSQLWEAACAASGGVARVPTAGEVEQLRARRLHDTWDRLDAIVAPTLICAGRHDGVAPPQNAVALASRIARRRLELFDGGHRFLRQDPGAWRCIIDFLARREDHGDDG